MALKDFSFDADIGECIGVVGRNGAGKTTLFKLLSDIQLPEEGSIFFNGVNITNNYSKDLKRQFGVCLDGEFLIEDFNAYEYLEFISKLYALKDISKNIFDLINYFFDNLDGLTKPIKTYSYGMRQKILLISSIIHRPLVLILDEPFNGLDVFSSNKLLNLLKRILPHSIIFIASHNLNYINQIATSIVLLEEGETLFKGTIDVFLSRGKGEISESLYEFVKPDFDKVDDLDWIKKYPNNNV